VEEATQPQLLFGADADAVYTLQGYLADESTLDLVYLTLVDVAHCERLRSAPVVAKCAVLLKRYLFRCAHQ
jgi:hypothetical protein